MSFDRTLITTTLDLVKSSLENWNKSFNELETHKAQNNTQFDMNQPIAALKNISAREVDSKISIYSETIIQMCNLSDDELIVVPHPFIDQLHSNVEAFSNQVTSLTNQVNLWVQPNNSVLTIDMASYVLTLRQNNRNANQNFQSLITNACNTISSAVEIAFKISSIVKPKSYNIFTQGIKGLDATKNELASIRKDATAIVDDIKDDKKHSAQHLDNIKNVLANSENVDEEITSIKGQVESTLAEILKIKETGQSELDDAQVSNSKIRALENELDTIFERAEKLKSTVASYEADFNRFNEQLKSREESIIEGEKSLTELTKSLTEQQSEINLTIEQAKKMLSASTNAGLASAFDSSKTEIDTKLDTARNAFYVSIFLLFVSSTPLAFHTWDSISKVTAQGAEQLVSMKPKEQLTTENKKEVTNKKVSAEETLKISANKKDVSIAASNIKPNEESYNILKSLGFVLLMIPFFWLTRFTAANHASLFKLREKYNHKNNVAMSVEGFKLQAPKYENEIAFTTFSELLENPAEEIDGHEKANDHPNPVVNWVMNKAGINHNGKTDNKAKEESKAE